MQIITRKEALELGLKKYFTGKPCKHGHISERRVGGDCIGCARKYHVDNKVAIAERKRQYREENKEVIAEKRREYYNENKEVIAEKKRNWYEENKGRIAENGCGYRERNRELIAERGRRYYDENLSVLTVKMRQYREANKGSIAEKGRKYRENNPIPQFIRHSLQRIFTNWKCGRTDVERLHGYTYEQLKLHIESQFVDGMSWENRSEWHIDHIKPISVFIREGVTDPKIINALSNLQPLWAFDNLSKGAKYDTPS